MHGELGYCTVPVPIVDILLGTCTVQVVLFCT